MQQPIYFVSKTLIDAEKRYLSLEKLVLATRKLTHYFQSHTVIVYTKHQIRSVLAKSDLSGEISAWAVKQGNFDNIYKPRTTIKWQVLADFMAEFSDHSPEPVQTPLGIWTLSTNGSSTSRGAEVGIVITDPQGLTIERAICLGFNATNNEAEYEAILLGVQIAYDLGARVPHGKMDSQLIAGQYDGSYKAKDDRMATYQQNFKN